MSNHKEILEISRSPVESSNIASIGYDEADKVIEIEFWSGGVYRYMDCEKELYDAFLDSKSKGQFFHKKIKDLKTVVKMD